VSPSLKFHPVGVYKNWNSEDENNFDAAQKQDRQSWCSITHKEKEQSTQQRDND